MDRFMRSQRLPVIAGLTQQLPGPEVNQGGDVRVPVHVRGLEHRAEHVVHRRVAVEVPHQHFDVVPVDDVTAGVVEQMSPARRVSPLGQRQRVHAGDHARAIAARSASNCTTIGNSTLFSLWMCRWVSASNSAIAAKHATYEAQPSAGGV